MVHLSEPYLDWMRRSGVQEWTPVIIDHSYMIPGDDFEPCQEVSDWLRVNVSAEQSTYLHDNDWFWDCPRDNHCAVFFFKCPKMAVWFKLTWG